MRLGFFIFLVGTIAVATPLSAEEDGTEEISVIGSRSQQRAPADLAVPVDVLDASKLLDQGDSRTDSMLARVVPSLNVDQQPISDAATIVRPVNLRGLPPDSTLVLINGKRRHRSSVIAFLGAGINDGAHGADTAAIPAIALDRVEVLRDGAAAQYGSDAVAGILNFVLKDDSEGGQLSARYGQYYYGDGENVTVSGNMGLPLGDMGFLNLSGEYNTSKPTSRSVQRADAEALIAAGNTHVRTPAAQVWGAPDIDDNYKLFANAGIELSETLEAYAFGSYAERTVDGGFFFRHPHTRDGIFNGGKTDQGVQLLLVIDHNRLDGLTCPSIPVANNVPDGNAFREVVGRDDCYVFNENFPGGFTPQFGGDVEDHSIAGGIRGELMDGSLTFDLSAVYGEHETDFFIYNTINPQLAYLEDTIPTAYDPGLYREKDYTINLDFTTEVDVGDFASPLSIGFGVEHRNEEFEIEAGEENSHLVSYITDEDGNYILDGDGNRQLRYPQLDVGSNGFPGFSPRVAGKWDRSSDAAYIDLEADVMEDLLFGVAFRYEDPEDFDSTLDGKVSARVQATETFAFRGSFGTGFRVPTVGQANVQNVTTTFSDDGRLADSWTLSQTHPILEGIASPLDHEEAESYGLGAVFSIGALDVTIDYFHITVDDRIAPTTERSLDCLLLESRHGGECRGNGSAGAADEEDKNYYSNPENIADIGQAVSDFRDELRVQGIEDINSISLVRWFSNDFDTETEGFDIAASYPLDIFGGETMLEFSGNLTRTEIIRRNSETITDRTALQIEEALPKLRFSLSADHRSGPWRMLGRLRYYGEHVNVHLSSANLTQRLDDRFLFDMEVAYSFTDNFNFAVGAENLFDVDSQKNAYALEAGAEYPENSAFDFNGGFYYARATYTF